MSFASITATGPPTTTLATNRSRDAYHRGGVAPTGPIPLMSSRLLNHFPNTAAATSQQPSIQDILQALAPANKVF